MAYFRRFWVKELRHSENQKSEKVYPRRSMRPKPYFFFDAPHFLEGLFTPHPPRQLTTRAATIEVHLLFSKVPHSLGAQHLSHNQRISEREEK